MSEHESGGGFFLGFLLGLAVGAAASLLMAPASGEDLRHKIGEKGVEWKDQAQKLAEEARTQAMRAADQAKGQVEYLGERGRIILAENVKKAQESVQTAQERLAGAEETSSDLA